MTKKKNVTDFGKDYLIDEDGYDPFLEDEAKFMAVALISCQTGF